MRPIISMRGYVRRLVCPSLACWAISLVTKRVYMSPCRPVVPSIGYKRLLLGHLVTSEFKFPRILPKDHLSMNDRMLVWSRSPLPYIYRIRYLFVMKPLRSSDHWSISIALSPLSTPQSFVETREVQFHYLRPVNRTWKAERLTDFLSRANCTGCFTSADTYFSVWLRASSTFLKR